MPTNRMIPCVKPLILLVTLLLQAPSAVPQAPQQEQQQQQSSCAWGVGVAGGCADTGNLPVVANAAGQQHRVAAAFVTKGRQHLFALTYMSFRRRCLDCDQLVAAWLGVDDFSDADDLAAKQAFAPEVEWLYKRTQLAGHVGSLNVLLARVREFSHLVVVEDDFHFVAGGRLISMALDILDSDPSLGQALFNENYRDTDGELEVEELIPWEENAVHAPSGQKYYLHRHVEGDAWQALHARHPGKVSHYHWPHFSLRWAGQPGARGGGRGGSNCARGNCARGHEASMRGG